MELWTNGWCLNRIHTHTAGERTELTTIIITKIIRIIIKRYSDETNFFNR